MLRQIVSSIVARGPRYTWKKVIFVVTIASLSISGSAFAIYFFYNYLQQRQMSDTMKAIQAIVHTTPQSGIEFTSLQTTYLAEVLGLSRDFPSKLSHFDLNDAKNRLMATHIFRDVKLKKIKPDVLFISYMTRTPLSYLEDYSNTALCEEGYFFPYQPLFTPQHLPNIYLGNITFVPWGNQIEKEPLLLIKKLFLLVGKEKIKKIDLSQINAPSAGKRELIIVLNEGTILRVNPKKYEQQIINYLALKNSVLKKASPQIIDLRIPEVAYIEN